MTFAASWALLVRKAAVPGKIPGIFLAQQWVYPKYPLVNVYITMENHHFQ